MSFFIGNDSSNKKVVHLTSSRDAISTMKGSPIPTTIYHSRMQLIEFSNYTLSTSGTVVNRGVTYSKFSGAGLSEYLNDKPNKAIMCLSTGFSYLNHYVSGDIIHIEGSVSTIILLVIKEKTTLGSLVARDIVMDGNGIYSGATNLTRLKYLTDGAINTHDPVITVGAKQYQLVNYNYKSAGLEVKMNGTAPYVKLGGHKVLGGGKVPTQSSYHKANYNVVSRGSAYPFPNFNYHYTIPQCDFFVVEIALTSQYNVYWGTTTTYNPPAIFRSELVPYGTNITINHASMFDVFIDSSTGSYGVSGMFWTIYAETNYDVVNYYNVEVRTFG